MRIVRGALRWALVVVPIAVAVTAMLRDGTAALSVGIASAVVLGNALLAAGISALAGRISTTAAAFASLPSFTIRMALILAIMALLRHQPFIDAPTFALTFGVGVMVVLVAEARTWRRTPWIAMTLKERP